MLLARRFELTHDAVALGGRGVDGNEVVVMQVDAPGSEFTQNGDNVIGWDGGTNGVAKWVAAAVPECPEAERKFVFRPGIVFVVAT